MIKKYLMIILITLPIIVSAQNRTVIINDDHTYYSAGKPASGIFRHITGGISFVKRMIQKQVSFLCRLGSKAGYRSRKHYQAGMSRLRLYGVRGEDMIIDIPRIQIPAMEFERRIYISHHPVMILNNPGKRVIPHSNGRFI